MGVSPGPSVTMVIGGSTVSGPVASPASLLFNVPSGSTQQQQQTFIVNGNGTAYSTQAFKKAGCDLLHVKTGEDYVRILQRFFLSRNR